MKKSLFTKLMTTYFLIIVISYSLIAIFFSMWFYNHYFEERRLALVREGASLNSVLDDYINKRADRKELEFELMVIDRLLNARIILTDKFGYVIGASGPDSTDILGKQIKQKEIEEVRKGKIIEREGTLIEKIKSPMLTVGVPITINGQVQAAVFFNSSMDEINEAIKSALFVIWMSAFFAISISVVIIYYFSEKILIKPLGRINSTARLISKGDFGRRVDIESDDEIGDLAVSFNYMADSLQNLEEMRKSFIANISHELRSPMTSINGFITGVIDGTIPQEKTHYYLGIVSGEIKRLIRLINDLLDLARLESGEFSVRIGVFDVNELIRERVIKLEERINQKSINMDVVLTGSRMKVEGDRDRIDQVITNLLDNAIKFTPEGKIIKISTEIKEDRLLVKFRNEGKGIPKDDIKYIWDRFHKADKARSKGGGLGLGLSIVRQILNQHNQTIWAESGENYTEFTFTLKIV